MNKIIAFTPADKANEKYFKMMEASLRKFHTEEELPLLLIGEDKIKQYNDPMFFYRSTPIIAKELFEQGYSTIIKIDADSLIVGSLSEVLQSDDYDVGVVNNSNPREFKKFPYTHRNVHQFSYANNGFVVMKNKLFVDLWETWCTKGIFFKGDQMCEQGGLNDMIHGFQGYFKVKRFDEGDSYYGLAGMGYYPYCELVNNEIILRKGDRDWPPEGDKKIKIVHFAGGTDNPMKMNYRILFNEEIVKYIDDLFI